jgi:hypothetical protein
MKSTMRSLTMLAGICLGLLLPMQAESAENNELRNLSAEWWQWLLSIPPAENPSLDPTGDKCVVGQRGSTWFLAGTFGGPVTRTCSVPTGKEIFFPVANSVFFDSPNRCGQGPEQLSVAEMRAILDGFIAGVSGVSVELDGRPVRDQDLHRVRSKVFGIALPEENLFDAGAPCEAGIYSPSVADGYYVLLEPLAAGQHTLRFRAENPEEGFVIDTTYHLTVVPVAGR